jgi:hypothetical protein
LAAKARGSAAQRTAAVINSAEEKLRIVKWLVSVRAAWQKRSGRKSGVRL